MEPINIVIVTSNAVDYTKKCIESVRRYTSYPYFLTVVDNGSTDGTLDYLRSEPAVRVIANKENLGYGGAIVQGYESKPTGLLCVMNNDVIVSPGWLESLTKTMQQETKLGILGPLRPAGFCHHPYREQGTRAILKATRGKGQIPSPKGWLQRFCHPYDYEKFVEEVKRKNNFGLRLLEGPPSSVSTCCALINTTIAEKAGGLADPRFYRYGCEDVDLCWRISTEGFKIAITSGAYIHHFKHISADVSHLDRKSLTEENMRKFFDKWEETIKEFLTRELQKGRDIERLLEEEDLEFWFLARLRSIIGPEKFWQGVEKPILGKERKG